MAQILLVCRGNLCRSPMAQAITVQQLAQAQLARRIRVSTAGTHAPATSGRADPRALQTLKRFGYSVPRLRTRAVVADDFRRFDQILAMDRSNLADLKGLCPAEHWHKLQLFLQPMHDAPEAGTGEVPDPYFGALAGFERVLRLCEAGARGWVAQWARTG